MANAYVDASGVGPSGGRARLFVDGKEIPPLWYALSDIPAARTWCDCSRRGIRNFAACGIHVVCIDTNLHECWQEGGTCDVEPFLRHIRAAVEEIERTGSNFFLVQDASDHTIGCFTIKSLLDYLLN